MTNGSAPKILIVDDDPTVRRLLTVLLRRDYVLAEAESGEQTLALIPVFAPDLVLLDITMPGIDGHETCRRIKSPAQRCDSQVIMLSGRSSRDEQLRAYQSGADDYLIKPFDRQDLLSRIRLHVQLRQAKAHVAGIRAEIDVHDRQLRQIAEQRAQEIIATQDVAVFMLAKIAESRDQNTGEHLLRMRAYSQILAEDLAHDSPYADQIDRQFLDDLYRSSPLHDIGKVGIRDEILLKPGRLTPEEFADMKQHSAIGAGILDEAVALSKGGSFLAMAASIARYHHERFDGKGYPTGLAGLEIPLPARIVALADVYDALTSARPYKPAYPAAQARNMIDLECGRHFDPVIVAAFQRRFADFLTVQAEATPIVTNPPIVISPATVAAAVMQTAGTAS